MRLVGVVVSGGAMFPKYDGDGRNDDAKAAAAAADADEAVGREGCLFLTDGVGGGSVAAVDKAAAVGGRGRGVTDWRARNVVASSSVMEMPPMMMFKVSSGAGALLNGEDMVVVVVEWIERCEGTNDQDL